MGEAEREPRHPRTPERGSEAGRRRPPGDAGEAGGMTAGAGAPVRGKGGPAFLRTREPFRALNFGGRNTQRIAEVASGGKMLSGKEGALRRPGLP